MVVLHHRRNEGIGLEEVKIEFGYECTDYMAGYLHTGEYNRHLPSYSPFSTLLMSTIHTDITSNLRDPR